MPTPLVATVKNEIVPWIPPRPSARLCAKCGRRGQVWRWWKIAFCRACLCLSIRRLNGAA